jgi:hypothetical protein
MLKKILFLKVSFALLLTGMQTQLSADTAIPGLLWELEGLNNPESVVYDKKNNVLYVSNVNGQANEKDGNGFISKVSLDGAMIKKDWVTGLDAPKGLAIHGDKLYTADIDTLVEIDIPSSTITSHYKVEDAVFLNDVAAGEDGEIFVSDMMKNRIHSLKDGKFSVWLETPELLSPNGLHVDGGSLVVGAWGVRTEGFNTETPGHLLRVMLRDKSISSIGDGSPVGNLDGVEADLDGDYYVTDWVAGKLFHIDRNGHADLMLTLEQGMADLEFIASRDLILLPMMLGNKLLAYELVYED